MAKIDSSVLRAHNMLLENATPESIPGEIVQQAIIQDSQRAGREYRRFLENGAKLELVVSNEPRPEDIVIHIPALPRPTLAMLRASYPFIREENGIERDTSPTDAVTLRLAMAFSDLDGDSLGGKEYELRLTPKLDLLLGYQQATWLVEHQDEFPELMALLGKIYIDFPGLVVVREDGYRYVVFLSQRGKRWYLYWHWLQSGVNRDGRVALSRPAVSVGASK